jgi:hypothetical protein
MDSSRVERESSRADLPGYVFIPDYGSASHHCAGARAGGCSHAVVRNGARRSVIALFDGVPKSYRLDLVSSTASSNRILELRYRRHR